MPRTSGPGVEPGVRSRLVLLQARRFAGDALAAMNLGAGMPVASSKPGRRMSSTHALSGLAAARAALAAALGAGGCASPFAAALGACSASDLGRSGGPGRPLFADVLVAPNGVVDRGADPAVVGLVAGGVVVCSGVLLAEDLVLSARHCAAPAACAGPKGAAPGLDLGSAPTPPLSVLVGEDAATGVVRANVRSFELPDGADACTTDLAVLWLDAAIRDVQPLRIKTTGTAAGDHARAVAFGPEPGAVVKRVYDHVRVSSAGALRLGLELAPCALGCGGPLLDEGSAAVTAIVLGPHAATDAGPPFDVAARVDPWMAWLERAVARGDRVLGAGTKPLPTRKGPIDIGAACLGAIDCAAGVCVRQGPRQYCSRPCDPHDRCPLRSRCEMSVEGAAACVLP